MEGLVKSAAQNISPTGFPEMQIPNHQSFETTETPRIGRKPMFDEQTRHDVIMAWEERTNTQSSNLVDFLAEKLGVYPDGSPKVSPQTFYAWRRNLHRKKQHRNQKPPRRIFETFAHLP